MSSKLSYAIDMGTRFAVYGWSEVQIGNWLLDNGFELKGLTAQRIRKAYFTQLSKN